MDTVILGKRRGQRPGAIGWHLVMLVLRVLETCWHWERRRRLGRHQDC